MISLLIPTRKRPVQLMRAIESARQTASNDLEFCLYLDDDDRSDYSKILTRNDVKYCIGPRIVLAEMWNRCFNISTGDILLQGNDDCVWQTRGWDQIVYEAFENCPDKILMVHGSDGSGNGYASGRGEFAPHPLIHRRWVETIGYFTPSYFSSDFCDTWINDLANGLGRRRYLPFVIEHKHFLFGKAEIDETTSDRLARHSGDQVENLYQALAPLRRLDVAKLQRHIAGESKPMKWSILILTQPSRATFLSRLLHVLEPQLREHPDVELKVRIFDSSIDLGANRQAMIDEAAGEFVNFIDDDDMVPGNYVGKIYPLLDAVDYIGFRLQMDIDGQRQKPTFHSLRYPEWNGDEQGWYRDISHVNPIRRELLGATRMSGGSGEDARWANDIRARGVVKHEHFIDEVMYFYHFRSIKNDPQPALPPAPAGNFFAVGHRRPECPKCGSTACGIAGGLRRCNQCQAAWA
jgi:glycosyltransferase involved in cell wall biosynthesis